MSRRYLPVALALVLFGLPLFIGLGRSDMDNDEAIYSYSVERMLALHDWLTPRAIYDGADDPFLEKPPLKTWIVAAGQLAGLPRDEFGLRFFDPLFAIAGFAYVFALGRRLAGALCGIVAVFVLLTFQPLVFEHGLRSNNMESAMLLMYCGGIYHFLRWTEEDRRVGRRHAWACAGYFAFGFLAKFVAAAFLPIVMAAALLWRRDAASKIREAAAEWVWPAVAALAAIAPWFVYQGALRGRAFWNEVVGHQVFTRFTSFLDPNHLRPWHYYFVELWKGLAQSGDAMLAAIGLAWLVIHAWRGRPPLVRILLLWWIVPFALISLGTSKLIHYMYPFIPPIALGAGAAAAAWMDFWNARSRPWQPRWALQYLPAALSLALLLIALWTAQTGPLAWKIDGLRVLRTTTAIRPLMLGVLALCAAGSIRMAIRVVAVVALAAALPIPAYAAELRRLGDAHLPLHSIRDCISGEPGGFHAAGRGVTGPGWMIAGHSFFYYFRSLGPYHATEEDGELRTRMFTPALHTPVILDKRRIAYLQAGNASLPWEFLSAVDLGAFVVVLPGPYESCTAAAVAAGGQRFEFARAQR